MNKTNLLFWIHGSTTHNFLPQSFIIHVCSLHHRIRNALFCLLIAALFLAADIQATHAAPPTPYLVADINTATLGSTPQDFVVLDGFVYFRAADRAGVRNLWKSDGTATGTVLIREMGVEALTSVGSTLYFVHEFTGALWQSDGTTAGTVLVKDLTVDVPNASLRALVDFDGTLFFIVDGNDSGYALWQSDGTAQGTTLVKQISPTAAGTTAHWPTVVGDTLYFAGDNPFTGIELWKSDGTSSGTMLVKDIYPNSESGNPQDLTAVGDALFLTVDDGTSGRELWQSDGTLAGTMLIKDIHPDEASSAPRDLVAVGDTLYFSAYNDASGRELWKSDGTDAGTMIVKDIVAGADEGFPANLANVGGTLYFRASTNNRGAELWKSDGTDAGTRMVKDIEVGEDGSSPWQLTDVAGTLFFVAYTETRGELLWKSDGTSNGTVVVKDVNQREDLGFFNGFTPFGSTLIFRAEDGTHGSEIWRSDGTTSGTKMLKDLSSDTLDSGAEQAVAASVSGQLFFSAYQEGTGRELWLSDGTESGTRIVKDIFGGSDDSYPSAVVYFDGAYYFSAANSATGIELWKSDGTEAGTTRVKDIYDGIFDGAPATLTPVGNLLFFSANDSSTGRELWKSDGTEAGTVLVKDIYADGANANPTAMTDVNGTLFFVAEDGSGKSLWKGDGSTGGTTKVMGFYPGDDPAAQPYNLSKLGDKLLFWVTRAFDDSEFWVSDGTAGGTTKIKSIADDFDRGEKLSAVAGDLLYFAPSTTATSSLWASDGTVDGTQLIRDFSTGETPLVIHSIQAIGAKAYVTLSDGSGDVSPNRLELWESNGSPAGTMLVKTMSAGSGATAPDNVADLNLQLFFVLGSCTTGQEIWASNGTGDGTVLLTDDVPNFGNRCLDNLTHAGSNLFFAAKDARHGEELWAINLGEPLPGKIILEKRATPASTTTTFPFAGDFTGTLLDREPVEITDVAPASYTLTEGDAAPSYYLYDIDCDDENSGTPSTWTIATRQLTLNVDPGETIRCTSYSSAPGEIEVGQSASIIQAKVGDTVEYTYQITNSGSVTLTDIVAVDDQLGPLALSTTTLAPGAAVTSAKSYTVLEADLPGPLANAVTVTGAALGGPQPSASAAVSIALVDTPDLSVRKTADMVIAAVGDPIHYTYLLRNEGDSTLTDMALLDDSLGKIALTETTLAPGQEISSTKTYTVGSTDLPGPLQSTATVSYAGSSGLNESQTAGVSIVLGNVILTIDENQSGQLAYIGPDTKQTTISTPFGAVDQMTSLLFRTLSAPSLSGSSLSGPSGADGILQFAGKAFVLSAYQNDQRVENFTFTKPISLTIEYTDSDVVGLDENQLDVYYYDVANQQWRRDGIVIVERDLAQNRIIVTLAHLTEFGLWGPQETPPAEQQERLYLPLITSSE